MSALSIVTETVTLSDGRSAVVRRLGWKAKKAARDAKQLDAIQIQKAMGVEFQNELRKAIEAQGGLEKLKELAAANPHLAYDQAMLLYRGVVSISDATPTPEQLDDLDDGDAEALARAVLALSPEKTEAERKNS
jgi:hypothetical protein